MPKLIIVSGLPATGKSTLVKKLSADLRLPAFSKDEFKELFADTIGFVDHESTRSFGKASFQALFLVARRCLEDDVSVIIEGNFILETETKDFILFLKKSNIPVYEILCHADGQTVVDRFFSRKRHPVHHTLTEAKNREYAETLRVGKAPSLEIGKLMEVDTTNPESIPYRDILDFLK